MATDSPLYVPRKTGFSWMLAEKSEVMSARSVATPSTPKKTVEGVMASVTMRVEPGAVASRGLRGVWVDMLETVLVVEARGLRFRKPLLCTVYTRRRSFTEMRFDARDLAQASVGAVSRCMVRGLDKPYAVTRQTDGERYNILLSFATGLLEVYVAVY